MEEKSIGYDNVWLWKRTRLDLTTYHFRWKCDWIRRYITSDVNSNGYNNSSFLMRSPYVTVTCHLEKRKLHYILLRMRTQLDTITQIYAWYDISSFRIRTPLDTKMHKLWWDLYSIRITWIMRAPLDTITHHLWWEIHGYDNASLG